MTDTASVQPRTTSFPILPPRPPALVDGQRRGVRYLRLSVTDRCSFRCRYCMPADGVTFVARSQLLTFDEMVHITRAFVALGVNRVRLTGGEPLLRRDLTTLVAMLSAIPGLEDLSLSTNALQLRDHAVELKRAGLRRVNISIDSLRPDRFRDLTRTGELDRVLDGIAAAREAGLTPVKLNAVVLRGFNDDELADLVRFAAEQQALLRFIEYMPIGVDGFWSDDTFVSSDETLSRLARDFDLSPVEGFAHEAGVIGGGPARYLYAAPRDGAFEPVRIGLISALSHNFCGACNRVRLTARGTLQPCLAYPGELSLRDALRAGASVADLTALVEGALFGKGAGHQFDAAGGGVRTFQSMSVTGG